MIPGISVQRAVEALVHSNQQTPGAPHDTGPGVTIAISRQAGAGGTTLARALGERLGWPVFDRELLQQIAEQTGLRVRLLEDMDEKRTGWLREFVETFFSMTPAAETVYLRHLIETLGSLAARGNCIIVGRGAPQVLPLDRTLRMRVVANREDCLASVQKQKNLSAAEAARWIDQVDRERRRFVMEHFQHDPHDPIHQDLMLNTSRFTIPECVDIVVAAVRCRQNRLRAEEAATSAGKPAAVGKV
jgi:cytidylate kinase